MSYVPNALILQDTNVPSNKLNIKLQDQNTNNSLIETPYKLDVKGAGGIKIAGQTSLELQVSQTATPIQINDSVGAKLYALPASAPNAGQMVVSSSGGNLIFQDQPVLPNDLVHNPMQSNLDCANYQLSKVSNLQLSSAMFVNDTASMFVTDNAGNTKVNFNNSSTSNGSYFFDAGVNASNFITGSGDLNALITRVNNLAIAINSAFGLSI
jgi:hypothetical protein